MAKPIVRNVWPDLRAFESGSILGLGVDGIHVCVVSDGDSFRLHVDGCGGWGLVDGTIFAADVLVESALQWTA